MKLGERQLVLAIEWPERMTDDRGENTGLQWLMMCNHFVGEEEASRFMVGKPQVTG
jgi:hypothetical protein